MVSRLLASVPGSLTPGTRPWYLQQEKLLDAGGLIRKKRDGGVLTDAEIAAPVTSASTKAGVRTHPSSSSRLSIRTCHPGGRPIRAWLSKKLAFHSVVQSLTSG